MTTMNSLFASDTATFVSKYQALDFSSQLFVWIELQRRVLEGDNSVFVKYLMPVLTPIISSMKQTLPIYGTYREDFAQEAMIAVYSHLSDYNPYYKGERILGTVYFKNCIRTVCTNVRRQVMRDSHAFGCDDFDVTLELNDAGTPDLMTENIIKNIVVEQYEKMNGQYSSAQYARKQTRKWAESKRISYYDIFS